MGDNPLNNLPASLHRRPSAQYVMYRSLMPHEVVYGHGWGFIGKSGLSFSPCSPPAPYCTGRSHIIHKSLSPLPIALHPGSIHWNPRPHPWRSILDTTRYVSGSLVSSTKIKETSDEKIEISKSRTRGQRSSLTHVTIPTRVSQNNAIVGPLNKEATM